jgi:hypothetical protein
MKILLVGSFEEYEHAADRIARILDTVAFAGPRGETTLATCPG